MDSSISLAVSAQEVYKSYGRGKKTTRVLKRLNMEVPYNTIFGLLGASGCGKTTLLKCILSSLDPDCGEIKVLGSKPGVAQSCVPGKDVGYMPQDIGLIPEFTSFELMVFFGVLFRMPFKKIRERIRYLIELLELPSVHKIVGWLSGGQQRRVSFAVALLQGPSLLILDEPTVGLDPLLRVKIWRHLVELTTTQQTTVIITTHYIEEAKMAHLVGFMRDGRLLAQSSPENLMRAYNTTSLEAVFLKLAYESSKKGDKDNEDVENEKQYSHTEQASSKDKTPWKFRMLNFQKFRAPTVTNIVAMSVKTFWKICKSILYILLLIILPAILVTCYCTMFGNDVKDVKLLTTNNDNSLYDGNSLSEYYLRSLSTDIFDLENISSYQNGLAEISDGDAWGTLELQANYTTAVVDRYQQVCTDILEKQNHTSIDLINRATIRLGIDTTDRFLTQQSYQELFNVANENLISNISQLLIQSTALYSLNVDLNVTEIVYGNPDFTFRDAVLPGAAVLALFAVSNLVSSVSLVQEKNGGILDRTYVAGVTITELILSELLLYSVLAVVQVVIVVTILFGAFDIELHGNIALASFIYWLISLSGLTIGLLISLFSQSMVDVIFLASMCTNIPSYLAGAIWPLEGIPSGIRWVSYFLPITYAVDAVKAVISKGMGIGDKEVYQGILITLAWWLFYLILIIVLFRR